VERIGIRELRNDTSRVVRRAKAGERILVTIDGVPAAQLVPLDVRPRPASIEELVATGRLIAPQSTKAPRIPTPVPAPPGPTTTDTLLEHRDR
jgi:prevent-host-death family protein